MDRNGCEPNLKEVEAASKGLMDSQLKDGTVLQDTDGSHHREEEVGGGLGRGPRMIVEEITNTSRRTRTRKSMRESSEERESSTSVSTEFGEKKLIDEKESQRGGMEFSTHQT